MEIVRKHKQIFEDYCKEQVVVKDPVGLYQPIEYIMRIGGKRLRPVLTLWACELFGGRVEDALPAALAVEVFHNFTLIHDDIMDHATIRRGFPTVHEKWDKKTGILSGDAMMIMAYRYLEYYQGERLNALFTLFNRTALEVCEGQQMDMAFETCDDVSIDEYISMISLKTSVLIGAALQMGCIVAGASKATGQQLFDFGKNLGIAFQLQDDYLDTFGLESDFGKRIGGDIEENKKTYLYLRTLELANETDSNVLKELYSSQALAENKVDTVRKLFDKYGVREDSRKVIMEYTSRSFALLVKVDLPESSKILLREFGESLMKRTM